MLCPAASGRGGAWCGQSLVVGSLSILVAREARLGWVPSHSRLPRRLDLGFKLDRTERPLGHSHRVELGRVWGWGHLGRCPCHMAQLWPLLVRRGPRLFRGHLVRCRPPEFRLREGAPGRREYQRGGLPNLDAEDARVQALELFDVDVLVVKDYGTASWIPFAIYLSTLQYSCGWSAMHLKVHCGLLVSSQRRHRPSFLLPPRLLS